QFLNTSFTETPTSIRAEHRPTLLLHPEDAEVLEVNDGELVRMGNDLADILIHAKLFDGLQPGVVVMESIWPNKSFIEHLGVNALVSAIPGKPNGGAIYHDTAVWIKPDVEA
ncbi:MAG: molybdopterin dinucleotide binding domain-containing protein, partial [Pseudomonadota bacterium]